MSGRHQAPYARYNPSNQPINSVNHNLNIPFNSQNNAQGIGHSSVPSAVYNNASSMASPYSSSSSPGHPSPNMAKHVTHNTQLKKYTLKPPPRLQPLSKTMTQLGYPGIFPQRSSQDEDVLTESNMRNGFTDRLIVSNEHTCAHDIVYGKLQDDQRLMNELGSFMVEVLKRKRKAAKVTGNTSFKPPLRSTLTDNKKDTWMQELALGSTPLHKMARNVPHGFKGEKLLETLAIRQVPFLRASWFIKIVGLSEMTQRNANNTNTPVSQANQWTIVVISHLKKQLSELTAMNATPHNSNTNARGHKGHNNTLNHYDSSTKPWASPENRARFEQRWLYSTRLTRWQYCEGLLDQRTFLRSSLDALLASGSFEVMWLILTGLVQDYVDEYRRNRTLMKLLIETLIKTYNALQNHTAQIHGDKAYWIYCGLQKEIKQMLQSLFLSTPDVFVIPKLYHQYRDVFDGILGEDNSESALQTIPEVCSTMKKYWAIVKSRNEVFCGTAEENRLKQDGNSREDKKMATQNLTEVRDGEHVVHVLDNIGRHIGSHSGLLIDQNGWMSVNGKTAKSAAKAIFGTGDIEQQAFVHIIKTMCQWATSDARFGDWRSYLISSILLYWRDSTKSIERKTMLQDSLIGFLDEESILDESEAQGSDDMDTTEDHTLEANTPIILLFGTLIRLQLFSYQKYLLRLIARGELEPSQRHKRSIQQSLHYLASFPLLAPPPAGLVHQRRVAIYGVRNTNADSQEKNALIHLKRLAKLTMTGNMEDEAFLFGENSREMTNPEPSDSLASFDITFLDKYLEELAQTMQNSTRYVVQLFCDWLMDQVMRFVVKSIQIGEDNWRVMTTPGSCLLNTRQYITIIKILESAKDYTNIVQISLWVLKKTNERALYLYIIDSLRKYANIWKLSNYSNQVAEALWEKHQDLQSRGVRERCIMMYIVQLVQEGYRISDERRAQLQNDLQTKPKFMTRHRSNPLPITTELAQIIQDHSTTNIQSVADSLCVRYQGTPGWIGLILQGIVEVMSPIGAERRIDLGISKTPGKETYQHTQDAFARSFEFYQIVSAFASLMEEISNQVTITGELDEAIANWLSQQCSPTTMSGTILIDEMNQEHSWVPLFITLLVVHGSVSLEIVLKDFAIPWFRHISQETQQANGTDTAEHRVLQFSKNLVALVRLLVVREQCKPSFEDSTNTSQPWMLRIEDIFRLETSRQTYLTSGLDKIEPLFGLMEYLVIIGANLPLSSTLLRELVMLRADLLKVERFRQACIRDLDGVYQRFATQDVGGANERKTKKKMLSIVDELIGGNPCFERQGIAHDLTPSFVDKLSHIFMNVSQWNEELCRVQVNLLLDNILLSDGSSNPNNPHILGDDSTTTLAISSGMDSSFRGSPASTNEELALFVEFSFNMALSDDNNDRKQKSQRRFTFLKNMLNGIREPVLSELLSHGVRLLEGCEGAAFPENVLLLTTEGCTPNTFESDKFSRRSHAFLNIMQHMIAEDVWTTSKKIELLKSLHVQIKRYKDAANVYKVMEGAHVSYSNAIRAMNHVKNNVDNAISLLMNDGISGSSRDTQEIDIMLQDIRTSLLVRLKLVVPFAALIWEYPKAEECDILEWVKVLVSLLGNPLVHGNGSQEKFFEFVLDLVSLLIDEVPRELRKPNLVHLSSMNGELAFLPSMFLSRVKRILPFLTHNIYITSTRLASSLIGSQSSNITPQQQQQHLENCMEHSKPWEWLEDYVSDPPAENDAPINISLFDARKAKKSEGTYAKWYKSGFSDKLAGENEHDEPLRVSLIGKSRKRSVDTMEDNGFIFIVDDDEDVNPTTTPKRRLIDMEEGELP
ncbi:hypothetical protein CLU79DRAFT_843056 [Phycomyces nitens]|nr:hypothetical protein CLU79DRAFT_843056 [Phycomyces nitens]